MAFDWVKLWVLELQGPLMSHGGCNQNFPNRPFANPKVADRLSRGLPPGKSHSQISSTCANGGVRPGPDAG